MVKCCLALNILLNIILILLSCSCIGIGIWLLLQENLNYLIFGSYAIKILGWVAIGCGIWIIITTIIGFCSTKGRKTMSVLLYVGSIGLCFLVVVITASLLFTYQQKVHDFMSDQIRTIFIDKYSYDKDYTSTWDEIQASTKCCGVDSSADYKATKWFNRTEEDIKPHRNNVPSTCCTHYANATYINEPECVIAIPANHSAYIFNEGCLGKLKDKIVYVTFATSISLFVVGGVLLVALVSGCVMLQQVRREVAYGQVV